MSDKYNCVGVFQSCFAKAEPASPSPWSLAVRPAEPPAQVWQLVVGQMTGFITARGRDTESLRRIAKSQLSNYSPKSYDL